jgi:PhnB protein
MSKVKAIPDGYHSVTPMLIVKGAARAIEFYKLAFGAKEERPRLAGPGGKIVHAELTIGDAVILLGDEFPEWGDCAPKSAGDVSVRIALYVEDVDDVAKRAEAAGAKILIPVADQVYGDRSCRLVDPFGHVWLVSTHKEDVSADEIQKRMEALSTKPAA